MAVAAGKSGRLTDPQLAERFVESTGVDLLAVSVGNVHVMTQGEEGLDLERLEAIHRRVSVPLVLHGGSGISLQHLKEAIRLGVRKVNFGTYVKQCYLEALRDKLRSDIPDPHQLLGIGGAEDILVAGRLAVRDAVAQRISYLGCAGKA
jgi:fructose/tagatose bisphosphate aldolase